MHLDKGGRKLFDSDEEEQDDADEDEEAKTGKGVKWGEDVKDFTRKKTIVAGAAAIGTLGE
jgi:hypothetical protein